jgi:hypothetical protein
VGDGVPPSQDGNGDADGDVRADSDANADADGDSVAGAVAGAVTVADKPAGMLLSLWTLDTVAVCAVVSCMFVVSIGKVCCKFGFV